jgi:hypothetical protein
MIDPHESTIYLVRAGWDVLAAAMFIGWAADWLPAVATLLTVICALLRIWETATVRGATRRLRTWLRS